MNRPPLARVVAALAVVAVSPAVVFVAARGLDSDRRGGTVVLVGVLAVAVAALVQTRPRVAFLARRAVVVAAAAVAAGAAGLWGVFEITALSAVDPESLPLPDVELLVLPIAVLLSMRIAGLAYGAPPHRRPTSPPAAELPRAEVGAGQVPRWRHDTVSGFFVAAVLSLVVVGAVAWRITTMGALVCWVVALLTIALVRMRIELDERGFALSAWGWSPAMVLPWERIVEAHAVSLRPLQRGGWGSRVIPMRGSIVLRKGPGLVLALSDGRRLGVTLDDPVLPAGLVNTYLDRLRGGSP